MEQQIENITVEAVEVVEATESNIKSDKVELQGEEIKEPTKSKDEPIKEKLFKQIELDEIINKRLSKEGNKHQKEIQQLQDQHKEQYSILDLKYKALETEYSNYRLDIEFQEEQKKLEKIGVSKEAIQALKAVKQQGNEDIYNAIRATLVTSCFRGYAPKSAPTNFKATPKKNSFLD